MIDNTMLCVENLTVLEARKPTRWGERPADPVRLVDDVSFSVAPGESVSLVAEPMDGPGTLPLVLALLGMCAVSQGTIRFENHEITALSERKLRPIRSRMPTLFSDAFESLPPHQTIGAMLKNACSLGARHAGEKTDRSSSQQTIEAAMEQARLPIESRECRPADLCPEERQRAALARALLLRPRLLILHHFTHDLDTPAATALLDTVTGLQDELGFALLAITAELSLAHHLAPELHLMRRGKIVESGPGATLLKEPAHDYTRRLIAAQFLPTIEAR